MTRGKRTSRRARFSPRWAFERLEERILLSGNVTASVTKGGNLAVVGLAQGSEILIQSTSTGALQVSSLDGTTTINGSTSPFTTTAVTGDVDVFMLQTNDVVDVGGPGTLTNLPHNLAVITLGGNDTVAVENATIGGNVTLFGLLGSDTLTVGSTSSEALVTVDGNVSISGGIGPTNTIAVFNANIGGNLDIASNGADDDIQVGFDAGLGIIGVSATAHVNVGGNLDITSPQSGGSFGLPSFASFGAQSLLFNEGAGFQFSLPGAGSFGSYNSFSSFGCGNVLSNDLAFFGGWCCGDGGWGGWGCGGQGPGPGDSTGQTVALADVSVTGNAKIQTGSGSGLILVGAAPVPSGDTSAPLNLVFGPVTVGGNLSMTAGNGNNTVFLDIVTVTGNTSITTGSGNDDIAVLGNGGYFNGTFSISAGNGSDSIAIINGATFVSSVTISAGRGTNVMWVAQDLFLGPVTINGGHGSNTLFESQNVYPNSFLPGYPVLNSIQNVVPDASPSDPPITTDFAWLNTLLGV